MPDEVVAVPDKVVPDFDVVPETVVAVTEVVLFHPISSFTSDDGYDTIKSRTMTLIVSYNHLRPHHLK